ncbi:MAG: GyrI-like domain-containing protein [Chloroflexota bacterium]
MQTLDLKKELKYLYQPSAKKIEVVDAPAMNFIMIDGGIEPYEKPGTSPLFQENMGALYGAAYTLKFSAKLRKENPFDYPVMASEGLWWVEDGLFDITQPGNWKYTLMIMQPDLVTPEMFADALAQLRKKKGDQPAFARLRLERFCEGLCVQTMHVGPYATEPATLERMRAFMAENGLRDLVGSAVGPGGKHHEIYMGNPLRADPSKLKTVLRHPVEKVG